MARLSALGLNGSVFLVNPTDVTWIGVCDRCGDVLMLEAAQVDKNGHLIDWRCTSVNENDWGHCRGAIVEAENQAVVVAAYRIGGLEAVGALLRKR